MFRLIVPCALAVSVQAQIEQMFWNDLQPGREAHLKAHAKKIFSESKVGHDHHEHTDLLRALSFVYTDLSREMAGAFIDGGAHRGDFTNELITTLGRVEATRYNKQYIPKLKPADMNYSWRADRCPLGEDPAAVAVYCFEPQLKAFEHLKERARIFGWANEQFNLVRAALAEKSGKVDIHSDQDKLDAKASFSSKAGKASQEKGVSLDTFIKKSIPIKKAFLARLSLNGYEMRALQGAKKSLKDRKLRYTLWEYSPAWADAGYNLKDAIDLHWESGGYVCMALLKEPVLITGSFFPEDLSQLPNRFYVFCGYAMDATMRTAMNPLGTVDYLRHAASKFSFFEVR